MTNPFSGLLPPTPPPPAKNVSAAATRSSHGRRLKHSSSDAEADEDDDPPPQQLSEGSHCRTRQSQGFTAGVNQPGVSYQFLTTLPSTWEVLATEDPWSLSRPLQRRAGSQLAQSGYSPLLAPYFLAGLGQTKDHVEELTVGVPWGLKRKFAEAIIPNSRLVVIPYPYNQTALWELRLYLNFDKWWREIALTLVGLLVALGGIICVLEMRERMQDAKDKKALAPALPL